MEEKEPEKLQSIAFSSNLSYINIGTSEGFRIYSSNPDNPVQEDRFRGKPGLIILIEKGNIKFIQNISNLVVYVRGGSLSNGRELYIYDDYHFRDADKMVFKDEILGIRLTKFW